MPGLDRRSSRWCCKTRAHALGSFHDDIVPGDVNSFYLKRRASPLLAPKIDAGPRHDRALLHQILKDQQSRSQRAEVLQVRRESCSVTAASENPKPTLPENFQSVTLPEISAPLVQASKHKGISNGMLHCPCTCRLDRVWHTHLLLDVPPCRGLCSSARATGNRPQACYDSTSC